MGERADRPDGGRLVRGREGYFLFDSLAVDAAGNVCVATIIDGGITVLSPSGGEPGFVGSGTAAPQAGPFRCIIAHFRVRYGTA